MVKTSPPADYLDDPVVEVVFEVGDLTAGIRTLVRLPTRS
jgi:hypothetical protein